MKFANKAVTKNSNLDHLQKRFTRNIEDMNPVAYRTVQEDVRELIESAAHDSIQSNEEEAAHPGSQTQRSYGTSRRPQFLSPNLPEEEKWKLRQL